MSRQLEPRNNTADSKPEVGPNLDALLDLSPLSNIQRRVLVLVGCAIVFEGFDIQVLGICAPAMMTDWHLTKQALGPAMAAALVGMTIGAFLGGQLGDRFGRRPFLLAGMALFSTCTLAIAAVGAINDVMILRFVAGLAFGTALSNGTALVAEWVTPQRRLKAVGWVIVGVPAGGMLGAALCSWLIPISGWRSAFLVAGALPLILTVGMVRWLPESIQYIAKAGNRSQLVRLLSALNPNRMAELDAVWIEVPTYRHSRGRNVVWQAKYRWSTIGLAVAFFANLAVSYALFNWAPVLLTTLNVSPHLAVRGAFLLNLCGTIASVLGLIVAQSDSGRRFVLAYVAIGIVAAAALATLLQTRGAFGVTDSGQWILLASLALVAVGTNGSQTGLYGLAAAAYPTSCRSGGIGIAAAFGRVGGVFSSFAGGALLGVPHGPTLFLFSIMILFGISGIGVTQIRQAGS